jgi:hypothetical protein
MVKTPLQDHNLLWAFKKSLCRAIQKALAGQIWNEGPMLATPDLDLCSLRSRIFGSENDSIFKRV